MTRIRTLLSRALAVFCRAEIETEMNEEIRSHVEELEEDYRRSGLSAQEAHRRAVLAFGGIEQVKERYRDRYRLPALDSVLQDIVFAARMLVKHPGFTVTGIVTLALGIGGNTAIFSIVNAVLLKPAPFPDPDRLVMFMTTGPGTQVSITSPARFQYLRTLSTIQDAAAFRTGDTGVLTYTQGTVTESLPGVVDVAATSSLPLQLAPGGPFRIMGKPLVNGPFHGGALWTSISSGYFQVFRIPIKRGRTFTDRDDASAPPVVIINESMAKQYWTKGDDPLNARILIAKGLAKQFDDEPERQIVGIVGDVRDRGLNLEPGPSMYVPQAQVPDAVTARGANNFPIAWVIRGNVAPSSLSRAIQEQLRQVTGLPLSEIQTMDNVVSSSISRQRFNTLLMTVFACLALALAAIGTYGLMAYSVEQRTPEIGIRLALGAEAADVGRMIVLQGMRLVVFGVVIGVPLAFNLTKFIQGFLFGVEPGEPVTFVTIPVVVSVTALLAVWLPARRASRTSLIDALRYE